MLAQNFKSAADLGITEPQREALMKTLVLLETGKLIHVPVPSYRGRGEKFSHMFNMAAWRRGTECGTIACIGGTAELVGNTDFGVWQVLFNKALRRLFFRRLFFPDNLSDITPTQAATALRSYLTTGNARWDLAVQ